MWISFVKFVNSFRLFNRGMKPTKCYIHRREKQLIYKYHEIIRPLFYQCKKKNLENFMQQKVSHGHIYHLNNGFMFETGWTEFEKYSVFWNDGLYRWYIIYCYDIFTSKKEKSRAHSGAWTPLDMQPHYNVIYQV